MRAFKPQNLNLKMKANAHVFAQTWRLHYQETCTLKASPKGRYANTVTEKK